EMYSMHIDSVFCCQAHYGGVQMAVLPFPCVTFHIEHSVGSGWTPEGADRLFERMAKQGIRVLEYPEFADLAEIMRASKEPFIFNSENWGFANTQETMSPSGVRLTPLPQGSCGVALRPNMSIDKIRADHFAAAYRVLRDSPAESLTVYCK